LASGRLFRLGRADQDPRFAASNSAVGTRATRTAVFTRHGDIFAARAAADRPAFGPVADPNVLVGAWLSLDLFQRFGAAADDAGANADGQGKARRGGWVVRGLGAWQRGRGRFRGSSSGDGSGKSLAHALEADSGDLGGLKSGFGVWMASGV